MLTMNKKMSHALHSINRDIKVLPPELSTLIEQGFCIRDGCILLAALADQGTNVTLHDFPDKTGYECFINSFHVEDYVKNDYLSYAYLFVEVLLNAWVTLNKNDRATAIVSSDESGTVVKLHVSREGESWLADNLEGYEEAILMVDSAS